MRLERGELVGFGGDSSVEGREAVGDSLLLGEFVFPDARWWNRN